MFSVMDRFRGLNIQFVQYKYFFLNILERDKSVECSLLSLDICRILPLVFVVLCRILGKCAKIP